MNPKLTKILAAIGIALLAITLFIANKQAYLDSDNAWYAIMGKGIASGNILLANWVSSTISHYFPYAVTEGIWAFFINDSQTIHALSIVTLTTILFLLLWFITRRLHSLAPSCIVQQADDAPSVIFLVLSAAAVFIAMYPRVMTDNFAHIAPALLTLTVAFLYYCKNNFGLRTKIAVVLLLALWSDGYNFAYFLIPLLVETFWRYYKAKQIDPRLKYIFAGMGSYAVLHILREMLPNYVLQVPQAILPFRACLPVSPADWGDEFVKIWQYLAESFSANLNATSGLGLAAQVVFLIIMVCGIALHAFYGQRIVKKYDGKDALYRFLAFILISSILIIGIVAFTNVVAYPRYLVGPFINCLILLLLFAGKVNLKPTTQVAVCVFIFLLSLSYQKAENRFETDPRQVAGQELVKVIRQEGLHYGYAWPGGANPFNFAGNEMVVAALAANSNEPNVSTMEKTLFYKEKFDFILKWTTTDGDWCGYDMDDEQIRKTFGEPLKTIDHKRVRIYVYNNISDKVPKPKHRSPFFLYRNLLKELEISSLNKDSSTTTDEKTTPKPR